MEWKDKFSEAVLAAGKEYYEQGKVVNLRKTDKGYEASVAENHIYQVRIGMRAGRISALYCECPVSKIQTRCKHMAAVLYAAEENEDRLAQAADPKTAEEPYSYFRMDILKTALELSEKSLKQGQKLIDTGEIRLKSVNIGYTSFSERLAAQAEAEVLKGRSCSRVSLIFDADSVIHSECSCPGCAPRYYWYDQKPASCMHIAAVYLLLCAYFGKYDLGDATDKRGSWLIHTYQSLQAAGRIAKKERAEQQLVIEPRLVQKDGMFDVDFRVGEKGSRLFAIKKLSDFADQVDASESVTYGNATVLNHDIRNFTKEAAKYISFIREIVSEEREYASRHSADYLYSRSVSGEVGRQIPLFGKRLDDFYDLVGSAPFEYEERKGRMKEKKTLRCAAGNPKLTLNIQRIRGGDGVFHGVEVSSELPVILSGFLYKYYIEEQKLCRMDPDFARDLAPLLDHAQGGGFSFQVGRHKLQQFYYTVLPKLREYMDVKAEDEEIIERYLQPEVRFIFYLDAENQDVTCRLHAVYGEKELSLMDHVTAPDVQKESFRDSFRESEALWLVGDYFPYSDPEHDEFSCGGEEERVYRVLSEGIQELMQYGEVQSTNRFRNVNLTRRPKVSVGVSLESGLLNLDISSEDISQQELLEVLASYRSKKKYHRMRDGSFLSLEDDTYEMLSELIETMHIRPKEFVAGKMQIPAYRALYLDKMLEENDQVYTMRDSRFKKLIKEFRTVSDSDYEIPESLRRVLRNYQKTGYCWLRTLQDGHFGGILADDMGLGKTLQVITLLLAHKEEGKQGTTLIVCPASLVFNWAEEFARYAPALQVCCVTGTQDERQKKLGSCASFDVLITSYDLLKRDIALYEDLSFFCEVLDEAQFIKNHTTAAAKSVRLIRSETRFALTGTPIENRLSELWSIFDYLMPGFLYRYENFKKDFESRIVKKEDEEAAARLRRLVSPFILRRLKQDVLKDLPEKIEEIRYARFGAEQQKLYDAQVVHMRQKIAEQSPDNFQKNRFEILRELTRLRQICCDPALCFENYRGGSAKLEACLDLVQSAVEGGHKILLFSQFTSMLEQIQRAFDENGITYYVLTGSTSKEKRMSLVKRFNQDQVQVFLISLKAGGTGLNLTGADVVIHYDPWWNLAVQNQATDRAHRIGQTNPVTVYKLLMKHSIEEKIEKLQQTKQNLSDQIISGEGAQLSAMTQEELLELLA